MLTLILSYALVISCLCQLCLNKNAVVFVFQFEGLLYKSQLYLLLKFRFEKVFIILRFTWNKELCSVVCILKWRTQNSNGRSWDRKRRRGQGASLARATQNATNTESSLTCPPFPLRDTQDTVEATCIFFIPNFLNIPWPEVHPAYPHPGQPHAQQALFQVCGQASKNLAVDMPRIYIS